MRSFTRLRPRRLRNRTHRSFTLLEVLVTLALLLVILAAVMEFMTDIDRSWKSAGADPFAEAQNAFETVAKNLASATLAPYQDYADANGDFLFGRYHADAHCLIQKIERDALFWRGH